MAIADMVAPHSINRIMCWENADGQLLTEIAVGQRIAPLPVAQLGVDLVLVLF